MTTSTIELQRRRALGLANSVRWQKTLLKKDLHRATRQEGLRVVASRLESHPSSVGRFRVEELVRAVRGIGKTKCGVVCREAQIVGSRRVDSLTERQRMVLAQVLRARALR